MDGNSVPSRFEQLWSVEQTAEYLALSVKTLYGWRGRKYGPPSYRIGNMVRDRPGEVRAWVDEHVMSADAEVARSPLPMGSWGLIRTYPVTASGMSKPQRYRAMANHRGFSVGSDDTQQR